MVGFKNMGWIPEITSLNKKSLQLGILSFETAKIMSRLVSLYKSLSHIEISRLRKNIMKSEGVSFLNSKDEGFLLSLACTEKLEDLDLAASSVSRFGKKCTDFGLNRFDLVYNDLKLGIIDFAKLEYGSRVNEKKMQQTEKLVSSTSCLHSALEALAELEISEKKMKKFQFQKVNVDLFNQKIEYQRKLVRHFRENSLWSKTFDKSVGLMARIICIVYVRICIVFGPYVPILPSVSMKDQFQSYSGPITTTTSKPSLVRFYSRKSDFFVNEDGHSSSEEETIVKNNRVFHAAGPTTLGGSGLALRYANVILLAEKYLDSTDSIARMDRESLYQMLPENLKILVRTKLSKNMKCAEDDELLAEGWRDAMTGMLEWLGPMAQNTVTWQMERNVEKMKFDLKPCVLLLETLHFSDREKTEAAIAELLVGLSCIYRFENRQICV